MARILVIDDASGFRHVISKHLTELGHEVREASDGYQGLRSYQCDPADIVLMDVYMPVKDGIELLSELIQHDPKARVIAVTGGGVYNNTNVLEMVLCLGARKILVKPFDMIKLQSAITELLAVSV